jgi:CRISPR-associated protein Cas2
VQCIIIYDIPSDRIRNKMAELCKDYGLNRIQYSAFAGALLRTHQEEVIQKARKLLGKKPGKVYLYCIGETEWANRLEMIEEGRPDAPKPSGLKLVSADIGANGGT